MKVQDLISALAKEHTWCGSRPSIPGHWYISITNTPHASAEEAALKEATV